MKSGQSRDDGAGREAGSEVEHDGTRASSLIPVHKLSMPDRHYDLQLFRDLALANELAKRCRRISAREAKGATYLASEDERSSMTHDGGSVKLEIATLVAMTGMLSIESSAAGSGPSSFVASAEGSSDIHSSTGAGAQLGPSYKALDSFAEFRRRLLADGWSPVPSSNCEDEISGSYASLPGAELKRVSSEFCKMFPELDLINGRWESYFDYTKAGRTIFVELYGDVLGLIDTSRTPPLLEGWLTKGGPYIQVDSARGRIR